MAVDHDSKLLCAGGCGTILSGKPEDDGGTQFTCGPECSDRFMASVGLMVEPQEQAGDTEDGS